MIPLEPSQIHGTCVDINGYGVLLLGASGAGKSDLALRLIESGAELVADDRVNLSNEGGVLVASAPQKLRGLLELRGVGALFFPFRESAHVSLAVRLVARDDVERLPEPMRFEYDAVSLPLYCLHAFDASTPAKIRAILHMKG